MVPSIIKRVIYKKSDKTYRVTPRTEDADGNDLRALDKQWTAFLAKTVEIPGCDCVFCGFRSVEAREKRRYCAPEKHLGGRHRPNNSTADLRIPPIPRESGLGVLYPNIPAVSRSDSRQSGPAPSRSHHGQQSLPIASRSHSRQGASRADQRPREAGSHPPPYSRFDPSLRRFQFPSSQHHHRDERNVLH